ncbi:type IV secretory system conjugative DNA transfer family protein [Alicyclobacillus fastidiosus]|uniref:type IV secretory system conjugative DNA transfer family protein n=1 Tax=Alicyclobacillus fastidiosus TaxID=392011 RepID=UPI0023E940D4|nr:type IV secretory system conjugative DNA transfer family protein [Alicyclobacillus fastidiosus]GMA65972.1 hypothetical protein GCM10025859_64140 [Alicyclobacillus fastidiosus]GMA66192.1 hypothetical protein GCM10025859_66340 [Alicyclobacillus fastidiosus]
MDSELFYAAWNSYRVFRINTDTRRKYKQRHGYAAYGTAHWQEKFETVNFYHHDNNGILLGDYKKDTYKPLPKAAFENPKIDSYSVHSFADRLNQQLLVFGPPGAGKTTGFILPNIFHLLQQGKSMVVTDPKGELYEHTANAAREEGYNVVVLDYLHFKYGARQNLLNYIFAEEQYAELASMYLTATRAEGEKGDFWESKAKELLTALIGFVHQAYGSKGTLTHVYELTQYVANDPNYLRYLFEKYNIQGAPKLLMEGVLGGSKAESMMASLTGTLSERLNLFTLSNVRAQTSTTDYDLSKLAEEKTIVYIWTSVSQETYKPLISTFWTVFFNTMYETARKHGGSLPFLVECLWY